MELKCPWRDQGQETLRSELQKETPCMKPARAVLSINKDEKYSTYWPWGFVPRYGTQSLTTCVARQLQDKNHN